MYAYDELDRTLINERVSEFRDQVKRRLSGELTEDEFKILRLQNGVYLQLHAYMFRVAIPYGTLSSKQLRRLAHVARRYDRGYGHFTTRQNIQFNWIKLAELPDALADLAEVGIHAMQTSGNNMRNVTSDQWAGVAPGEIEDPRIWSELIRQHTTLHPEFSFLPRKFKIAITAAEHDRAAIKIHDIGLRLHKNADGETGFEVLVGGGLGRTPFIAKTIKPFVSGRDILSYIEAILRVYNQYGRRDNIYKARIKILVHELGIEKFAREVEEEWKAMGDVGLTLDHTAIEEVRSRFSYPPYEKLPHMPDELKQAAHDKLFERWRKNSVSAHKVQGYSIVTLSLKPVGGPPGDATAERLHINISGCINACGHHHVGHIGILGVEKNGEEFYQITIGGRADENAQLGTLIGPAVPYAEVADVIEDIVEAYLALRDRPEELFVDTVKRLGVEPIRERVYATR
jgi:sulfite reductase (NADPH) hemoprotein beta-component